MEHLTASHDEDGHPWRGIAEGRFRERVDEGEALRHVTVLARVQLHAKRPECLSIASVTEVAERRHGHPAHPVTEWPPVRLEALRVIREHHEAIARRGHRPDDGTPSRVLPHVPGDDGAIAEDGVRS